MSNPHLMTSNKPYLIRAMYDWIADNQLTPYVLVDARVPGVRVPNSAIRDGYVVLNIAVRAVSDLELGNKSIRFLARFGGVSQQVDVPIEAVIRVYAQENEQGIVFSPEEQVGTPEAPAQDAAAEGAPTSSDPPPRSGGPRLRVVK